MKNALVIWGGWEGHSPKIFADRIVKELKYKNFHTTETCNVTILLNEDLKKYDVIIPIWSVGIKGDIYLNRLLEAIESGVGLATFHGGIKWFEDEKYYEMIGGFYLYDTDPELYIIKIEDKNHPVITDIKDFKIISEKYYLMTDPRNDVLAFADYRSTKMPISWTKNYGKGRVFYSSMAHSSKHFFKKGNFEMILNGIEWVSNVI